VRLFLASLIVLSVLPIEELRQIDWIFLPIFAVEFTVRLLILRRSQKLNRVEIAVLVADAIALISFLPIESLIGARVLRFFRLVRLILLGRFLRTLASDLRRILAQRHMKHQFGFLVAAVLLLTFVGGVILTTFEVEVDDFNNDGRSDTGTMVQVLWWVFRQIEDPGNLVEDSHGDLLLLITSLVLTIAGVFVMSFIIGIGTSVVGALMAASRNRPVHMREHTVVIGGGRSVRQVLQDLLAVYDKNGRKAKVAVLEGSPEPPTYLEEPEFRFVQYRSGESTSLEAHDLLSTSQAKRVIVLNNEELGESADAYAISSVLAVRQQNDSCPVVVEMRHRRYMEMAQVAGGQSINPLPMGKFLGSLMCQSLMFPGVDAVFEEIFSAKGSEIYTHIYSEDRLAELARHGGGHLCFREMLLGLQRRYRVILLGVLLGDGEWTHDVGTMTVWLNPLDEPPAAALALGARQGEVPLDNLRGLIALAPEYSTLWQAARDAVGGECVGTPDERPSSTPGLGVRLCADMVEMRRILILGVNELLPSILENTAEFVEGIEIVNVVPQDQLLLITDEMRRRLNVVDERVDGCISFPLPQGGRAIVIGSRGDLLADALEHPEVRGKVMDVAVLLAIHHEADPDALTVLTTLRLIARIRDRGLAVGPRFRIVAEVLSSPKGALLEARLAQDSPCPVRIIPTQQLRAYFLVHSAYVPGSDLVHLELLGPQDQDFCQLRLAETGEVGQELDFRDLLARLSCESPPVICFGVLIGEGHPQAGLMLNPSSREGRIKFAPSQLAAIYAVGETAKLLGSQPADVLRVDDAPRRDIEEVSTKEDVDP
jgi:hypothetical protein